MIITWEDRFSVGVKLFDDHHKVLIDLINLLHDLLNTSLDFVAIDKIFGELVKYVKYHFKAEEAYFDKYNYPNTVLHKKEHSKFVQFVADSYQDLRSTGYLLAAIELFNFLREWLIKHILVTDMKYTKFFTNMGIK